ncbi:MAG: GH1 family beta-glucosidase [Lachnospiraceae bacterium]|nr:GH1 family beta-glucosidase [Lachnospiraceae bacterium]
MFRDDFAWGVASSAYQIEGTDPEDGRGKCIWDTFCEEGKIRDKQNAIISADHMHRYKEDYKLMRLLGVKAYRFSLNWSRILPEGVGRINEKGIALYRDMIQEMLHNGITPYITMFHWELPQALQDQGGWLNPKSVEWFGEYAKVVAENFADLSDYFITLNEPECFVGLGNLVGCHAPGYKLPHKDVFTIAHHALMAHGQAVINLRKYAGKKIQIGYAPTCSVACPSTNDPADIEAARQFYLGFYHPLENCTWNVSWFSDPVFLGEYPQEGLEKFKDFLPEIKPGDMELIHQPIDFMGQNIYNGYPIRMGEDGKPVGISHVDGFPVTAAKWPVTPECLYWGVKFLYEKYKMPLYITENGCSCADVVSEDGCVHDPERIHFLDRYLSALQKASDEGVDIRGYFLWTFLDNFEWEKGYSERFGIVHVDFTTQRRTAKDSAFWYKKTMESNGANLSINRGDKMVLFIKPQCKERIWGGDRLIKEWGYEATKESGIGECWAISAHPEADNEVLNGTYAGRTLSDLWKNEKHLFGNRKEETFPLLLKIIDAKDDLSIQVHPDDVYAKKYENSYGKKECWYVLDCPENASLIVGNRAKDHAELEQMIAEGRFSDLCNEVPVKKGDFLQIDPGTLHAIKGGFLILETQQSSDVTYRVYDYDRLSDGKPRQLHLKQSLDVIKTPDAWGNEQITHVDQTENVNVEIIETDLYKIWSLPLNGSYILDNPYDFMMCSIIEGEGFVNGTMVQKGTHFLIPAGLMGTKLEGKMQIIYSAPM